MSPYSTPERALNNHYSINGTPLSASPTRSVTSPTNTVQKYSGEDSKRLCSVIADLVRTHPDTALCSVAQSELDKFKIHGTEAFTSAETLLFLRRSLEASQRRVESLNADLLRQVSGTEELLSSLSVVKDSNSSLIGEIQKLTAENEILTSNRILLEKEISDMKDTHLSELNEIHDNAFKKLTDVAQHHSISSTNKVMFFKKQLVGIQRQLNKLLTGDIVCFRKAISDVRNLIESHSVSIYATCRESITDIVSEYSRVVDAVVYERNKIALDYDSLKLKSESDSAKLTSELNEVRKLHSGESTSLRLQVKDMEKRISSLVEEVQSVHNERDRVTADLSAALSQLSSAKHDFETSIEQLQNSNANKQHQIDLLNSQLTQAKDDLSQTTNKLNEASITVRETSDALAAAVSGNEHLRAQLTEQRNRYQQSNEAELNKCRNEYEDRISQLREEYSSEICLQHGNIVKLENVNADRLSKINQLEADIVQLQHDLSNSLCRIENESNLRSREEIKSKAAEDRVNQLIASTNDQNVVNENKLREQNRLIRGLETELERANKHFTDYKVRMEATRAEHRGLVAKYAGDIKELEKSLCEQRAITSDIEATLHSVNEEKGKKISEMCVENNKLRDACSMKEDEIESLQRKISDDQDSFGRKMDSEQSKYNEWRNDHLVNFRNTCDEYEKVLLNERKLHEGEICKSKSENDDLTKICHSQMKTIDSLESENERCKYLLSESTGKLTWLSNEKKRDEDELRKLRHNLDTHVSTISRELNFAKQAEHELSNQLDQKSREHQMDKVKMRGELSAVRGENNLLRQDLQLTSSGLKQEYNAKLEKMASTFKDNIRNERSKIDNIHHENTQLRRFVDEHRYASQGVSNLQEQLETHIAKLQKHTEDLRSDLD